MAAMEIESVFAIESNLTENVNPVNLVKEGADCDTGLQITLSGMLRQPTQENIFT